MKSKKQSHVQPPTDEWVLKTGQIIVEAIKRADAITRETEETLNQIRQIQNKIVEKSSEYVAPKKQNHFFVITESALHLWDHIFENINEFFDDKQHSNNALIWYGLNPDTSEEYENLSQAISRSLAAQQRAKIAKVILKNLRQIASLLETEKDPVKIITRQTFLKDNKLPAPDEEDKGRVNTRFSISSAEELANLLDITDKEMANILTISIRTYHRLKHKGLLNPVASERLTMLKDLASFGLEVFENQASFNKWLRISLRELDNNSPLDLLNTAIGISRVKDVLGRIEYGIYS